MTTSPKIDSSADETNKEKLREILIEMIRLMPANELVIVLGQLMWLNLMKSR